MDKRAFFTKAIKAARDAEHVWPEFAACEAALESAWGESRLARMANNLFGQKCGFSSNEFPKIDIPTHENEDLNHDGKVDASEVVTVKHCYWPMFPDWATSFRERMELLQRVSIYKDALTAQTGTEFVEEVSRHWATDPERAHKILLTYHANEPLIMQIQGIGNV